MVVAEFCWKNVAGATGKGKWLVLLGGTVGPSMGVPQKWMVSVRENPIKMDDDWGFSHGHGKAI